MSNGNGTTNAGSGKEIKVYVHWELLTYLNVSNAKPRQGENRHVVFSIIKNVDNFS